MKEANEAGREILLSMSGVLSLVRWVSSTAGGIAAFVKIVGSALGCRRGDRGGVSAGNAIRRDEEYSTACVWTLMH